MAKRTSKSTSLRVTESVDFIFELLYKQGWVSFSMSGVGVFTCRICSYLKRSGIVTSRKVGKKHEYMWVADLSPTRTLYDNIVADYREAKRAENQNIRARTGGIKEAPVKPVVPGPVQEQAAPENPLATFSFQELWNEIKRRGGTIENNNLVLVRKEIFY